MKGAAILNFFKKAAKDLAVGAARSVAYDDDGSKVKLVPAIAPLPMNEVDTSYGEGNPIERPDKEKEGSEEQYQKDVLDAIKTTAQQRSLPYKKRPEVALAKGGLVKKETVAKVAEKGPELVIPVKDMSEAVGMVYKQGAALIISSSLGFLKSIPPSTSKGTVIAEASKLQAFFGITKVPKPSKVIGLKAPLKWYKSEPAPTGGSAIKQAEPSDSSGGGGGGGIPGAGLFRTLNKLRKVKLGKRLKFLKKSKVGKKIRNVLAVGKKATKGISKVAKSGGKLLKGASKASKLILKKGAKKIGAKVGAKALAKVGGKALGKGLLKKIPFVGLGAGLLFAGQRLMAGDMKGALLEAASGIAGTIPGVGTAISIGLDATLAAKDMGVLPGQKQAEQQQSGVQAPDPTKDMYGRPIILNPSTMKAWKKAVNAAAKEGINLPMSVTSSYRSPEQQQALIDAAEAGDENAINPAPVGQSPHGQGWAIDIDYYSKANEWMREKGKKYGFQWQGEKDPVHFDLYNNEPNDKWLQPGKNKWIPNLDDPVGKPSASSDGGAPQGGGGDISPPDMKGSAQETLNETPVTQGGVDGTGEGKIAPTVVPVPTTKIVYLPAPVNNTEEKTLKNIIIDPHGKGSGLQMDTITIS